MFLTNIARSLFPDEEEDKPLTAEEVEEEERPRTGEYVRVMGYDDFIRTDEELRAEEEADKMLALTTHGIKIVWKREWYGLLLKTTRLEKLVKELSITGNSHYMQDAAAMKRDYYDLLRERYEWKATERFYEMRIEEKDNEINRLNEIVKRLMPTQATRDPETNRIKSESGLSAADNQLMCYWLDKAGKTMDYIKVVTCLKTDTTVKSYIAKGKALADGVSVNVMIDGISHRVRSSECTPTGMYAYEGCVYKATDFALPGYITAHLD